MSRVSAHKEHRGAHCYEYVAVDAQGAGCQALVHADTQKAAIAQLRDQNLIPLELREYQEKSSWDRFRAPAFSPCSMNRHERLVFLERLGTLVDAGLSLDEVLGAMENEEKLGRRRRVVHTLRDDLRSGSSFAQALAKYPRIFPPLWISMLEAGERAGQLAAAITRLARFAEDEQSLRHDVQGALAYPLFLLLTGLGVCMFLLVRVVPELRGLFMDMRMELPLPTQLLVTFSTGMEEHGLAVLGGVCLCGFGLWCFFQSRTGRPVWDALCLRLPIWGVVNRQQHQAQICGALSALLQSGVPLSEALGALCSLTQNVKFSKGLHRVQEAVVAGTSLASAFRDERILRPFDVQMLEAGERGGRLVSMLQTMQKLALREVKIRQKVMLSLVEPVLILALGSGVGFLVLAVLLPLFRMSELVG